jgi:hypothetical protein
VRECYISLEEEIKNCSIPKVNGDLLLNLSQCKINIENNSFQSALKLAGTRFQMSLGLDFND